MRPIKSIIVFNSGTAGDFLTALCWSQLFDSWSLYAQRATGRVWLNNMYFKKTTQAVYQNNQKKFDFDFEKIHPVENSHFWLDCYLDLADRCVFINYPEQIQQNIFEIYLEKVCDNKIQNMINLNIGNQHPYVASKMNVHNTQKIINHHWLKNVRDWRANPALSAIELEDFFTKSKMENIVRQLIGQDILDQQKFDNIYSNWMANNFKLRSLFCDATNLATGL